MKTSRSKAKPERATAAQGEAEGAARGKAEVATQGEAGSAAQGEGRSAAQRPKPGRKGAAQSTPNRKSAEQEYRSDVAAYVAAGGEESVQRVITAVHGLARKLDQWYARQLADLDLSAGEWAVLSQLARTKEDEALTPTQLAEASSVAPSSMTHRLDRMAQRNLVSRAADPHNRTRVLITLTDEGWQTFTAAVRESNLVESDVLGPLSPHQREDLASLLELLIEGLDEPTGG